jgi:hypothetical protein
MDQRFDRLVVEAKLISRNIGNKLCARLAVGIKKFLSGIVSQEVLFVLGSQEGRLVMIKPPRQFVGRRILEVHDGVLIAVKQPLIEKISRPMQQSCIADFRFGMYAFFVKTSEGRG